MFLFSMFTLLFITTNGEVVSDHIVFDTYQECSNAKARVLYELEEINATIIKAECK